MIPLFARMKKPLRFLSYRNPRQKYTPKRWRYCGTGRNGMKSFSSGKKRDVPNVLIAEREEETPAGNIYRPAKELKGFCRVFLKAGESRDVTITIGRDALSYWDETSNGWKAEPGAYVALLGTSSDNLPLQAKFELK